MLSFNNKKIAFYLSLGSCLFSWLIIFSNIVLRIVTFNELGIYNIDVIGFFFTTLLLTSYTLFINFKITNFAYFPIILFLLHMATLNGSMLAIIYVIIDLVILFLLNVSPQNNHTSQSSYFNSHTSNENSYYERNNKQEKPQHKASDDNVFDAEYKTK
ncbi:MAG: hypothetical protein LBT75_00285 [Bacilli bacterium]|jgi:hypothetical protein|nr:hypothetical protein [Bacilli bacterium]